MGMGAWIVIAVFAAAGGVLLQLLLGKDARDRREVRRTGRAWHTNETRREQQVPTNGRAQNRDAHEAIPPWWNKERRPPVSRRDP
jgi:hypothetical protein